MTAEERMQAAAAYIDPAIQNADERFYTALHKAGVFQAPWSVTKAHGGIRALPEAHRALVKQLAKTGTFTPSALERAAGKAAAGGVKAVAGAVGTVLPFAAAAGQKVGKELSELPALSRLVRGATNALETIPRALAVEEITARQRGQSTSPLSFGHNVRVLQNLSAKTTTNPELDAIFRRRGASYRDWLLAKGVNPKVAAYAGFLLDTAFPDPLTESAGLLSKALVSQATLLRLSKLDKGGPEVTSILTRLRDKAAARKTAADAEKAAIDRAKSEAAVAKWQARTEAQQKQLTAAQERRSLAENVRRQGQAAQRQARPETRPKPWAMPEPTAADLAMRASAKQLAKAKAERLARSAEEAAAKAAEAAEKQRLTGQLSGMMEEVYQKTARTQKERAIKTGKALQQRELDTYIAAQPVESFPAGRPQVQVPGGTKPAAKLSGAPQTKTDVSELAAARRSLNPKAAPPKATPPAPKVLPEGAPYEPADIAKTLDTYRGIGVPEGYLADMEKTLWAGKGDAFVTQAKSWRRQQHIQKGRLDKWEKEQAEQRAAKAAAQAAPAPKPAPPPVDESALTTPFDRERLDALIAETEAKAQKSALPPQGSGVKAESSPRFAHLTDEKETKEVISLRRRQDDLENKLWKLTKTPILDIKAGKLKVTSPEVQAAADQLAEVNRKLSAALNPQEAPAPTMPTQGPVGAVAAPETKLQAVTRAIAEEMPGPSRQSPGTLPEEVSPAARVPDNAPTLAEKAPEAPGAGKETAKAESAALDAQKAQYTGHKVSKKNQAEHAERLAGIARSEERIAEAEAELARRKPGNPLANERGAVTLPDLKAAKTALAKMNLSPGQVIPKLVAAERDLKLVFSPSSWMRDVLGSTMVHSQMYGLTPAETLSDMLETVALIREKGPRYEMLQRLNASSNHPLTKPMGWYQGMTQGAGVNLPGKAGAVQGTLRQGRQAINDFWEIMGVRTQLKRMARFGDRNDMALAEAILAGKKPAVTSWKTPRQGRFVDWGEFSGPAQQALTRGLEQVSGNPYAMPKWLHKSSRLGITSLFPTYSAQIPAFRLRAMGEGIARGDIMPTVLAGKQSQALLNTTRNVPVNPQGQEQPEKDFVGAPPGSVQLTGPPFPGSFSPLRYAPIRSAQNETVGKMSLAGITTEGPTQMLANPPKGLLPALSAVLSSGAAGFLDPFQAGPVLRGLWSLYDAAQAPTSMTEPYVAAGMLRPEEAPPVPAGLTDPSAPLVRAGKLGAEYLTQFGPGELKKLADTLKPAPSLGWGTPSFSGQRASTPLDFWLYLLGANTRPATAADLAIGPKMQSRAARSALKRANRPSP